MASTATRYIYRKRPRRTITQAQREYLGFGYSGLPLFVRVTRDSEEGCYYLTDSRGRWVGTWDYESFHILYRLRTR